MLPDIFPPYSSTVLFNDFKNVDLPQPDGPIMAVILFFSKEASIFFNILFLP
jgi:hypothetical protein